MYICTYSPYLTWVPYQGNQSQCPKRTRYLVQVIFHTCFLLGEHFLFWLAIFLHSTVHKFKRFNAKYWAVHFKFNARSSNLLPSHLSGSQRPACRDQRCATHKGCIIQRRCAHKNTIVSPHAPSHLYCNLPPNRYPANK